MDNESMEEIINEYIRNMTSIRGRRVRKLIKREYGEFKVIKIEVNNTGDKAIIGENTEINKTCVTNGKGKFTKIDITNKKTKATTSRYYDMLHDSLKEIEIPNE